MAFIPAYIGIHKNFFMISIFSNCKKNSYYVASFITQEKEVLKNSKHQQFVSGMSIHAFWTANFVINIYSFLILIILLYNNYKGLGFFGVFNNFCSGISFNSSLQFGYFDGK